MNFKEWKISSTVIEPVELIYNYPNVPLEKPNHSNILKNLFNAYQLKAFFGID
jgi:hypothetical protein